jgi:hypothetical protein
LSSSSQEIDRRTQVNGSGMTGRMAAQAAV